MRKCFAAVLLIGAVVIVPSLPGLAGPVAGPAAANPTVLPPQSNPYGKAYGEWSGAWWQWALSIPADVNPLLDVTGANAGVGQSGQVWFLAGVWGAEGNVTRGSESNPIVVPADKAIFFPIYNWVEIFAPQLDDPPYSVEWSPEIEAEYRAYMAEQVEAVLADPSSLSCKIDGRQILGLAAYRCMTPPGMAYMVVLPENNVFGVPADTYGPSVDDGIWLMLAPLPVGRHTIEFQGGSPQKVTYYLLVQGAIKAPVPVAK
jgi:hypothetical protein